MKDLCTVLEGIFGAYDMPVIIYNEAGKAVWKNASAEKLYSKNKNLLAEVYGSIVLIPEKSGIFNAAGGGRFRKIIIYDAEYTAAELFDRGSLNELFARPEVSEYVFSSEALARRAVSSIYNTCEIIAALADKSGKNEISEYAKTIEAVCCRLIKSVTISSLLATAASEGKSGNDIINVDEFLKDTAANLNKLLPDVCHAVYSESSGLFIKSDRELLTYLMLGIFVRLPAVCSGEKFRLDMSAAHKDKKTEINFVISLEDNDRNSDIHEQYSVNDDDFTSMLAAKLDAEYYCKDGVLKIILEADENNVKGSFETDKIFFSENIFSPFRIMLSDLPDFNFSD